VAIIRTHPISPTGDKGAAPRHRTELNPDFLRWNYCPIAPKTDAAPAAKPEAVKPDVKPSSN